MSVFICQKIQTKTVKTDEKTKGEKTGCKLLYAPQGLSRQVLKLDKKILL
jgi:hypothetical protein